jgi:hypothetical protein
LNPVLNMCLRARTGKRVVPNVCTKARKDMIRRDAITSIDCRF